MKELQSLKQWVKDYEKANSLCEDLLLKGAYAMEKSLNFKSKPTI